jgi:hypothetical protein
MKLVFLRGQCDNGRTCPNINLAGDREACVVQGYAVAAEQHVSPGEAVVELPLSLLSGLAGTSFDDRLVLAGADLVRVRGTQVTDPDMLAELNLPAGENAVEIPLSVLPGLETTHAG